MQKKRKKTKISRNQNVHAKNTCSVHELHDFDFSEIYLCNRAYSNFNSIIDKTNEEKLFRRLEISTGK